MILGDRQEFALELDRFEPPWSIAGPDEAVWATVTVWVDGTPITEHRRQGTDRVRTAVSIPLIPVAKWILRAMPVLSFEERVPYGLESSPHGVLARWGAVPPAGWDEDSWLDRRDEWWSGHFTGAATPDLVVPSLGVVRNDDHAWVSWKAPTLPRPDRAFSTPEGTAVISWPLLDGVLSEYVQVVGEWAPPGAVAAPEGGVRSPLGLYTGLADHDLTEFNFLPGAESDPAIDPLAQVIRDLSLSTALGDHREMIVEAVRSTEHMPAGRWQRLRSALVPAGGRSLEEAGYSGAEAVRDHLGLDGEPLEDVPGLLASLDIAVSPESPAAEDRMIVAGWAAQRGAQVMLLDNDRTAKEWARRFELARALGHLLLDPDRGGTIGAASGRRAIASRRRRAGAFAAELLLPRSAVSTAYDGSLDGATTGDRFPALMGRFGVGARTAAFQLWNQGLLSSPEVRDDLIASYGAS